MGGVISGVRRELDQSLRRGLRRSLTPKTGGGVSANALRSRTDERVLVSRVNEQPLISRAA